MSSRVARREPGPVDVAADAHASSAARLERIYREHADRVYGLCLRLTGDRQQAAELVQDVFVRAWQKLHLLRRDEEAGAWLWRLASNVAFNDRRARRRREARVSYEEDLPATEAGAAPPSMATPAAIRRMDIAAALATLPDRARLIYLLHDVEGFSTEEIADQLQIAAGTVRAQLHRARHGLRKILLP